MEEKSESSTDWGGGDFGEIEGSRLVAEADAGAESDTAEDEHGEGKGSGAENGTEDEEKSAEKHGFFATHETGGARG